MPVSSADKTPSSPPGVKSSDISVTADPSLSSIFVAALLSPTFLATDGLSTVMSAAFPDLTAFSTSDRRVVPTEKYALVSSDNVTPSPSRLEANLFTVDRPSFMAFSTDLTLSFIVVFSIASTNFS